MIPYIMEAVKMIGSKKADAEKKKQAQMAAALGKMPGSDGGGEASPQENLIGGLLDKFLTPNQATGPKRPAIAYGKPRQVDPTGGQLNDLGFDGNRTLDDDLSLL